MTIKRAFPPNIDELEARFGPLGEGVIFTYAPHIYVPSGKPLPPPLEAHEAVHLRQQGDDPGPWWERYITDDAFRFVQELEAHRAEWGVWKRAVRDRNRRARGLTTIARRLASPLYGSLLTVGDARRLLTVEVDGSP